MGTTETKKYLNWQLFANNVKTGTTGCSFKIYRDPENESNFTTVELKTGKTGIGRFNQEWYWDGSEKHLKETNITSNNNINYLIINGVLVMKFNNGNFQLYASNEDKAARKPITVWKVECIDPAQPHSESKDILSGSDKKYVVIAVAGQSNSVGYDESVWSDEDKNTDIKYAHLGYFGENNLKVIPLTGCAENLQDMRAHGRKKEGTKGIHLPLAQEIKKHIPDDYGVLIVPVAYGGTAFTSGTNIAYDPFNKKPTTTTKASKWGLGTSYYETLSERVKYALDLNPENKFAGVVWCQGEHDIGSKQAQQPAMFQEMVNKLLEDWTDYANRTVSGVIDKKLWFVHDSCSHWREGNQKAGYDIIWGAYKTFLGEDNYVDIEAKVEETNKVNGASDESGQVIAGASRTSSILASHFGNNAFRTTIAPKVAAKMVAANVLPKAAEVEPAEPLNREYADLPAANKLFGTPKFQNVNFTVLGMKDNAETYNKDTEFNINGSAKQKTVSPSGFYWSGSAKTPLKVVVSEFDLFIDDNGYLKLYFGGIEHWIYTSASKTEDRKIKATGFKRPDGLNPDAEAEQSVDPKPSQPEIPVVPAASGGVIDVKKVNAPSVEVAVKEYFVYSVNTDVVNLGYAKPTKPQVDFCVDFRAKANPVVFKQELVIATKAAVK